MKNDRFVLIDNVTKTVTVYQKKVALASYQMNDEIPFTPEDIEDIRTMEYKDKA